jgi:hypothetical protein
MALVIAALLAAVALAGPASAAEQRRDHRPEHLRLRCAWVTDGEERAVACRWSQSHHPQFAGYRLVRADRENGRTVVFRTDDRAVTRFLDTGADPAVSYGYRVVALDGDGDVVGASRVVRVRTPAAA